MRHVTSVNPGQNFGKTTGWGWWSDTWNWVDIDLSHSIVCLQSWQNKFVLGCVNSPPQPEAGSHHLGQTFLAISVHMYWVFPIVWEAFQIAPEPKLVGTKSSNLGRR